MSSLNGSKFKSMKKHFDGELDPFNFSTFLRRRQKMDLDNMLKWYNDSSTKYSYSLMGDINGKHVLEIGCGIGTHLIGLAKKGAFVTGIDVSENRIKTAMETVKKAGLEDRVRLYVREGEDTSLPENSFDIVYGQDVLMFFDGRFGPFIKEMKRILKKGGALIFSEALDKHPVARFYRKRIAPDAWKEFTHYFRVSYLDGFRDTFTSVRYRTFYLTGFFIYAIKVYVPFYGLFTACDIVFTAIDSCIYRMFPKLDCYGWRIVFEARK